MSSLCWSGALLCDGGLPLAGVWGGAALLELGWVGPPSSWLTWFLRQVAPRGPGLELGPWLVPLCCGG